MKSGARSDPSPSVGANYHELRFPDAQACRVASELGWARKRGLGGGAKIVGSKKSTQFPVTPIGMARKPIFMPRKPLLCFRLSVHFCRQARN